MFLIDKPRYHQVILTMNHQLRFVRQLASACLGIAFSLLALIATPACSVSTTLAFRDNYVGG